MLINAAKICIPTLWGTTKTPSLLDCYKRINKIAEMEEFIAISHDFPHKFTSTWAGWSQFQTSNDYLQTIGISPLSVNIIPTPFHNKLYNLYTANCGKLGLIQRMAQSKYTVETSLDSQLEYIHIFFSQIRICHL